MTPTLAGFPSLVASLHVEAATRSALPHHVDGDAFGVGEDVFLDADGGALERVAGEQHVGDLDGEGFDEGAGFGGGEGLDLQGDGVVVHGAGDVIVEAVEALGGDHLHGDEEFLGGGAFVLRHADVGAHAQAADFDGVWHEGWWSLRRRMEERTTDEHG